MDGWIEWFGETGVPPDTQGRTFEIKLRDQGEHKLSYFKDPFNLRWDHQHTGGDIVAYRFVGFHTDTPIKEKTMTDLKTVDDVLIERGSRYGKFTRHASIAQDLKALFFHYKARDAYDDDDQVEALEMIFHKLGRIANGDHNYFDSWKDIAGYAQLVSDRLEKGEEK